jgi:hemoglobin
LASVLDLRMSSSPSPDPTPYELLGGDAAVHGLVNRFYDLMERDPAYLPLRALHAADLGPMRAKLADWMTQWLGGPQRYHARPDAACIGSAHAPYAIDAVMRDQWVRCMYQALDDSGAPAAAQGRIRPPLAAMAEFLRNR